MAYFRPTNVAKSFSDAFSDPLIKGVMLGQQLINARNAQVQSQYLKPRMEEELLAKQLANKVTQAGLPFVGLSKLGQAMSQMAYAGAVNPQIYAKILSSDAAAALDPRIYSNVENALNKSAEISAEMPGLYGGIIRQALNKILGIEQAQPQAQVQPKNPWDRPAVVPYSGENVQPEQNIPVLTRDINQNLAQGQVGLPPLPGAPQARNIQYSDVTGGTPLEVNLERKQDAYNVTGAKNPLAIYQQQMEEKKAQAKTTGEQEAKATGEENVLATTASDKAVNLQKQLDAWKESYDKIPKNLKGIGGFLGRGFTAAKEGGKKGVNIVGEAIAGGELIPENAEDRKALAAIQNAVSAEDAIAQAYGDLLSNPNNVLTNDKLDIIRNSKPNIGMEPEAAEYSYNLLSSANAIKEQYPNFRDAASRITVSGKKLTENQMKNVFRYAQKKYKNFDSETGKWIKNNDDAWKKVLNNDKELYKALSYTDTGSKTKQESFDTDQLLSSWAPEDRKKVTNIEQKNGRTIVTVVDNGKTEKLILK